jgi:hypothetical protein
MRAARGIDGQKCHECRSGKKPSHRPIPTQNLAVNPTRRAREKPGAMLLLPSALI